MGGSTEIISERSDFFNTRNHRVDHRFWGHPTPTRRNERRNVWHVSDSPSKARAAAAETFDQRAPQTPLHKRNNPYRLDLIFQALADRHRRLMVSTLSTGPETASELAGLAAGTLPAGMKHIQLLEASGVIQTEKVGRVRTCSLNRGALQMAGAWLARNSR